MEGSLSSPPAALLLSGALRQTGVDRYASKKLAVVLIVVDADGPSRCIVLSGLLTHANDGTPPIKLLRRFPVAASGSLERLAGGHRAVLS